MDNTLYPFKDPSLPEQIVANFFFKYLLINGKKALSIRKIENRYQLV